MAHDIQAVTMPKWGLSMTEGMVAAWHAGEGAELAAGAELVDIETTKITAVYESPVAGTLRRRLVAEGETVAVGALLAVVAESSVPDAEIDAFVARFAAESAAREAEAEAQPPAPETLEAGDRRLRYLSLGEAAGAPLVFVHGFGGDLNTWLFNQATLAEEHTTLALDLPGHGGSTKEVGKGDVGAFSAALIAFLDALGLGQAHLVGHSLGGAVALDLALRHPERVATLTLVASAALGPEINMDFIEGFIAARRRKELGPVLGLLVHDPSLLGREMIEQVLRYKRLDGVEAALNKIAEGAFGGGVQALELRERLDALTMPAQVIWGREDRVLPARHAEGIAGEVAVRVLEGAGHLVHMERAPEVNALIRDLVAS